MPSEVELYAPVKALLESQGYVVKGEVRGCDLVGVRGSEPPVVVELKLAFNLGLLLQGVDRLTLTDRVYLAIGARPKRIREVRKLCRRLGLGLLLVVNARVEVLLDPIRYQPRPNAKRKTLLLGEHARRIGDPNRGGVTRTPIVTAYRQQALRCAVLLDTRGPMTLAAMRAADDVPRAAAIMQDDVYGWFQRVTRGTYQLTPQGKQGLERFNIVPSPLAGEGQGGGLNGSGVRSDIALPAAPPTLPTPSSGEGKTQRRKQPHG